jgi:hypothetical protein
MEARASNTIAFPSSGKACFAATWERAFLFFQKTKVLQIVTVLFLGICFVFRASYFLSRACLVLAMPA